MPSIRSRTARALSRCLGHPRWWAGLARAALLGAGFAACGGTTESGPPPAVAVTVTPSTAVLEVGETTRLTGRAVAASGASVDGYRIAWSSGSPTLATVDAAGQVTAVARGTAIITATATGPAGSLSGTATVTVERAKASRLQIEPAPPLLTVGETVRLSVAAFAAAGGPVTDATPTWTSLAPAIATVDAAGVVRGIAPGDAIIRVQVDAVEATVIVRVRLPVVQVDVSFPATTLVQGRTLTATVTARDETGQPVPGRVATFSTSTPTIVSVTAGGLVTALAPGNAVVSARLDGITGSATLTVLPIAARAAIVVPPGPVVVGRPFTLSAVARDSSDRVITGASISWSSSDPAIATVSPAGVVIGVAPGPVTITATTDGATASVLLRVEPPVTRIELTPDSVTMNPGDTRVLRATARDVAGAVLTGRATTWRSSAPSIAVVDDAGGVSGVAPGRAVVTVASEDRTATAVVWVAAAGPVLQLRTAPAALQLPGRPLEATVIATPGFGTVPTDFNAPVTARVVEGDPSALIGTRTVTATRGVAHFDDLAFRASGVYRLQFEAQGALNARSELIRVGVDLFDRITTTAPTYASISVNGQLRRRITIPVSLRTVAGAPVTTPTTLTATVVRGRGVLLDGLQTEIRGGSGAVVLTADWVAESFDVQLAAPGFAPTDITLNTGALVVLGVDPVRAPADSVIDRGGAATFSLRLNSNASRPPVHSLVLDVTWPAGALTLGDEHALAPGLSVTVNRTQAANGLLRLVLASSTALPVSPASVYQLQLLGATSGRHTIQVTVVDARDALGLPIGPVYVTQNFIRVR